MSENKMVKKAIILLLFICSTFASARAADESYLRTITGAIAKGDTCTVIDDKFANLPLVEWNVINNISVSNIIGFELRQDTTINYYERSFTCTLRVSIRYFSTRDAQSPTEINNVELVLMYDSAKGAIFKVNDEYKFSNGFKVTVTVDTLFSPELGTEILPIFRIKNQIVVKRKYPFNPTISARLGLRGIQPSSGSIQNKISGNISTAGDELQITWDPSDFPGAEEYDLEWTFIDRFSARGQTIINSYGGTTGPFTMPDALIGGWMKSDNSRVTVPSSNYKIPLTYDEGFILIRVRSVSYQANTGLRLTSNWQYVDDNDDAACVFIDRHEPNLTWQYSAAFAEEGKRKDVISYFDATLRNRQSVTVNSSDRMAIVAETIYDNMGRPAVSILPSPVIDEETRNSSVLDFDKSLKYYPAVNLANLTGDPYSFSDIVSPGANCDIGVDQLDTYNGAGLYYSSSNPYANITNYPDHYFTRYVPESEGYPFAVTEYTADNTGRIRKQGGVGSMFQIGGGHETRYFYGKPLPEELFRLFGVEVGNSSHYQKNMVVDPNGAISVSYVDASGRTIATALAGMAPGNLDELPSSQDPSAARHFTSRLINPADFETNTSTLQKLGSANFLASTTGVFKVHYKINPAALLTTHGSGGSLSFCSNCYYEIIVEVKNDCSDLVASSTVLEAFKADEVACLSEPEVYSGSLEVPVNKIGEYTVTYLLRLSEDAIKFQTDYYIENNSDLKTIQDFFHEEMVLVDLKSCYSNCATCLEDLGTQLEFTSKMMALLADLKAEKYPNYPGFDINSTEIEDWIEDTYLELLAHCTALSDSCSQSYCELKLEQLKLDVRPGGQYAQIEYDPQEQTYSYTDRDISVLQFYNDLAKPNISGITFTNANGITVDISTLTESDFILAYMNHPEWADEFVKEHIEYCGYLWCIESSHPEQISSNADSYAFDEELKQISGAEAVTKNYYDYNDIDVILISDPFFQGTFGSPYITDMADDLANLSDIMYIMMTDVSGNTLPGKNILGTIDWILYCRPTDPNATAQNFEDSWTCTPSGICRSVNQEWDLYRNYYLQLKSKYMQLAKDEWGCRNCFIGTDGIGDENCVQSTPTSLCPSDPLRPYYADKIRIFPGYAGIDQYAGCMAGTGTSMTPQDAIDAMRAAALANLNDMEIAWIDRLKSVRDEEGFNISDADIENDIVPELKLVAAKWIGIAPIEDIRPASTLPSGITSVNGFASFEEVFLYFVNSSEFESGFSHELLDQPYPYNKTPVLANPISTELTDELCAALSDVHSEFQTQIGGSLTDFHNWLKNLLGNDYQLSQSQLSDLLDRCANRCRLTEELMSLPAFLANRSGNPDHPWVTCSRVTSLIEDFENTYSNVAAGEMLYRVLLTNYLNHHLGFSLGYGDYMQFVNIDCVENGEAILFNLSASPQLPADDFACVADIMAGVFDRAASEYEIYIEIERRKFRNAFISKCLSNSAWADLEGDQTEYHYTLYYYDQAGNLVKTIPPEGVKPLSDEQTAQVANYYHYDPSMCTGSGIPTSTDQAATFNGLNTDLSSGNAKAIEMWLYSEDNEASREVRIVTPSDQCMVQVAIHQQKLWVELYTFAPGSNYTIITLSNQAVADLSALPDLKNWSHLVIQSTTSLLSGTLQIYLDGEKLANLSNPSGYPFQWSFEGSTGSYSMPPILTSQLKHIRTYNRVATDAEVLANYNNYCLSPVGALAESMPLIRWGRFNIPGAGTATTTAPASTTEWANHFIVPDHRLATNYFYNSLNQVVKQTSPDGGTSEFYYDRLGRLTISQNQEQKSPKIVDVDNPANRFSYTRYDGLGRIIEVGEKLGASSITESQSRDESSLNTWLNSGSNRQVTVTAYDEQPSWVPTALVGTQPNLRKRVAATALLSTASTSTDPSQNRLAASYYSYDIAGNVYQLVQENTAMAAFESGNDPLKRIRYEYDLVSGKVNKVLYQDGKWDQFYYQYLYDAENRLIEAQSTRSNPEFPPELWITEATYRYYLHGPLARTELGHYKVQGLDYAYTLQGWLKGVNSHFLDPDLDMSADGKIDPNNPFRHHGRDVLGFTLGYFTGDYLPVATSGADAFGVVFNAPSFDPSGLTRTFDTGMDLFNGNIGHATYAIGGITEAGAMGYTYRYDHLNRLTSMRASLIEGSEWDIGSVLEDYAEDISYDANGNILTYFRNGDQDESGIEMDNLTYQYERDLEGRLISNRLRYVHDEVQSNSYTADIKTQTSLSQQQVIENLEESQAEDNYQYDETGNLISDAAEGIDRIEWTVYGKIRKITKGTTTIEYGYDAGGNRITKTVDDDGTVVTTFYVRDAQGNVLAVYNNTTEDSYVWREQHLYGSSRLGMVKPEWKAPLNPAYNPTSDPVDNGIVGKRVYELSNHLGNVMVTISDIKIGKDAPGGAEIDYYAADVVTAQDYYPFGMGMPGRKFSGSGLYRYGFNTQEKDNEIAGEGNHYTALYWEMDPRIGRRWNLDPKPVPWESGYAVNRNNPIWVSDPNGDFGNPDKDKKRHERAQKKFDKKVTDPLRKLEASLKESGVNDAVVRKTVQAEADRLADKYQNKSWLHWAIGKPDRDNTASSGYTSGSTGWHFTHRISIRAYKSEVYEVPTIEGDRPADGSMVTTGTVGTVLPGSTVSVQFNPLAQPNSLVVTTDNGSGGLSTIATTGGMISDEENRKGVYMFKTKTAITKVNAGQLQYEVRNSNVDVHKDTWQLKISITSPPVLNPVPLIYSGRPF